jgi:type II secretory pathway component PulC
LAKVDFQPVQSNGTLTGYRIQSRGDEADLTALGLQSGDIVVEIAGSRVGSADSPNLLAQLAGANELNLTVERGGALQSVSLSIPSGD